MAMGSDSPEMADPFADKLAVHRAKLESEPTNGQFWLEYGDFVDEEYDIPDEVVLAYENAARLLPNRDLRLRLGDAYVKAGKANVGLALIKESVLSNPRAHGFCFLADAYLRLEDFNSAKEAAEQSIILDPQFEEGYYLLGEAMRHSSRQAAIGHFRTAIELDDDYALAWQALGRELAANDDTIPDAILALRKAIELNPNDGWAMAFLANSLWRIDRIEEAELWYRQGTSVLPDCPEIKRWFEQFQNEIKSH